MNATSWRYIPPHEKLLDAARKYGAIAKCAPRMLGVNQELEAAAASLRLAAIELYNAERADNGAL